MGEVPFRDGPLDGAVISIWRPMPERLSLDLPERWGGPGLVFYEADEVADQPCYQFVSWDFERVPDPF